jgi:hypothetical protein
MDINARWKPTEASGADSDRATPSLGFNPGDLAVATTPAKGARRRRGQEISCTKPPRENFEPIRPRPKRTLRTWHPERRFATFAAAYD